MRAKSMKLMFTVLIATVFTFSVLGSALASPASDAFLAAKAQWLKITNLTNQDMQNAGTLYKKMVDNAWGNLSNVQKNNLQTTYGVNNTVLKGWLDNGFLDYIDNTTSHGKTGYDGFRDALDDGSPDHFVNLTYLINLAKYINDHGFSTTKLAVNDKGISAVDAIQIVLAMTQYKFEPGLTTLPADLVDGLRNDIIDRSETKLNPAALDECGIQASTFQAAINGLSVAEKAQLETILDKLSMLDNANLSGLTLSTGALTPVFAPTTTQYTAAVGNSVNQIQVTPTAADVNASISMAVTSGISSGDIDLNVGSNPVTVTVTSRYGTQKTYTLNAIRESVPPQNNDPPVPAVADTPIAFTIPSGVTGTSIQTAIPDANHEATLPLVQVQTESSTGTIAIGIRIPDATTVTGPTGWTGNIELPTVQPNDSVSNIDGTVSEVVEIGLGDDVLIFDQAVRLIFPGQAGKAAAYKRGNGEPVLINHPMSADSQEVADNELGEPGEGKPEDGKIDVGADLVIWTKHFTAYIIYTPAGGGGHHGGGGGGVIPGTNVDPAVGGTVELDGAVKLQIPAGTLQGTSSVKVLLEKATAPAAAPSGYRLLGSVYSFSIYGQSHYTFNPPGVTLTFTFDPVALKPGEKPVVEYYDETSGSWVNLGGTVTDNTISVTVNHFTKFAVMAQEEKPIVSLTDITGHWAENSIKQLVASGAITGYPDGSFKPDNNITRAEFATVLVKAFNLAPQSGKVFTDTDKHWAKDFIATAAFYGIIKGYDDVTFGPDDLITREQMAVMIVRAAKLDTISEGTLFSDAASISAWAKDAVATVVKEGIFKGYPDNTFKPLDNATRAEAVTVIVNALK